MSGGSMAIGAKAVATAKADGYTLLLTSNGHYPVSPPTTATTLSRASRRSRRSPSGITFSLCGPTFPAKSVSELVAFAKANPGKVTFGFGLSTPPQILGETLKNVTGADITSVPYRGGAPAVTDLLGGRIDMNFGTAATLLPLIRQGKVRAIAVPGIKRSPDCRTCRR